MIEPVEGGLAKDSGKVVKTAWSAYKKAPVATRIHVLVRALTCPMDALLPFFPRQGKVLDLGCGHGLLGLLLSTDPLFGGLTVYGIDHDAAKIRIARRMAGPGVFFSSSPIASLAAGTFDAVVLVDVLYTVNQQTWGQILGDCHRVLRPGAILLLKEVIDRPRWKYRAIMAQERLSVTVLGLTKGDRPHFESVQTYRQAMAASGFSAVTDQPLPQRSWISHHLFVARKPG